MEEEEKALFPIVLMLLGRMTYSNLLQDLKHLSGISLIPEEMTTLSRYEQLLKAPSPSFLTDGWIVIFLILEWEKAYLPIDNKEGGRIISLIPSWELNASSPILIRVEGRVTLSILAPWKAPSPISLTPSFTVYSLSSLPLG